MLKKLSIFALLLLASSLHPLFADPSDLQLVATTVDDDQITFQVGNPNTSTDSARIQVSVRVADGSIEVLTSSTVTVAGSSTSTVTVSATDTIVEILDDPQPF
jgi:hypothetical protein